MESQTTCCRKLSGELRGPAPLNPNLHPGGWQGPGLLHIHQVTRLTLQGHTRPHPQNLQGTRCPPETPPLPPSPWHHTGTGGSSWEASRCSLQPSGGKRLFPTQQSPVLPTFFSLPGSCERPAGPLGLGPMQALSLSFLLVSQSRQSCKQLSLSSWVRQSQI